ncbi:Homeobox-leucine zipper protein ROC8 [Zea mays]|uniref:Homeobox-leucine zipper protein ROC8 n=1 Tax=Zea mays TaxID=4577 RepID=A0A3L6D9F2_MAIZE|nr:Homeobox-leucine zipper protein ROC8 [Zea mays]
MACMRRAPCVPACGWEPVVYFPQGHSEQIINLVRRLLSHDNQVQEVSRIPNGSNPGNCISLLREQLQKVLDAGISIKVWSISAYGIGFLLLSGHCIAIALVDKLKLKLRYWHNIIITIISKEVYHAGVIMMYNSTMRSQTTWVHDCPPDVDSILAIEVEPLDDKKEKAFVSCPVFSIDSHETKRGKKF